jgi:quercetin dioxygenase-like cupin family protein
MAQKQKSENEFLSEILAGKVFFLDGEKSVNEFPWNPHASFKGVYLKHLIIGRDTESKLSCHIVKIEPNCVLDTHVHDGKIEIHEVIAGNGKMYLDNKKINYSPGKICVIPSNTPHKVVAGKKGMYILAKFTPSLL